MWPIIIRELRIGSRRWTSYWLRLLAAAAVVASIFFWFEATRFTFVQAGSELFAHMHRILLGAIWILVPLMMCDCLSRERREGTLGLLFLTDLRAWDIVCAKAFVHVLHALTLWAAVLPIIAVPLLLGGLHWKAILLSVGWTLGSIFLAAAAGIAASSMSRRHAEAAILAIIYAAGLFIVYFAASALAVAFAFNRWFPTPRVSFPFDAGIHVFFGGAWTELFSASAVTGNVQRAVLFIVGGSVIVSFLVLLTTVALAAWQIRRNWQDKPKTARQAGFEKLFCAPVIWTALFRRWMRWSLERNPIGWLEKRSWTGRIAALVWLAVMISFATTIVSYANLFHEDGMALLNGLMFLLLASIAYVAAGSFRRERETGALELILVTPLKEREIIAGRLRGIWGQFMPAFIVWITIVWFLYSWQNRWSWANLIRFTVAYAIIPAIGLYFSLLTRRVLLSWFATLVVTFAWQPLMWWLYRSALAIVGINRWDSAYRSMHSIALLMTAATHLVLAGFLIWHLHAILVRRSFAMR
jgi:ABC-type transport system involved in cytochrome c biogenesis permease component